MSGGLVAAYLVARHLPFLSNAGGTVFRDAGVVLIAGGVVCALGVVDDLFELDGLPKLGGQVLAAAFMVFQGVQFYYVWLPGNGTLTLDNSQAALATVFLVVTTVNAVNFIDGLDGLAAGVIGLVAVSFFLFSYRLAAVNGDPWPSPPLCSAARWRGRAWASCPTTCTRPRCSWATAARCSSGWSSPAPR